MPPRTRISTPKEVSGEISGSLTAAGAAGLTNLVNAPKTKDDVWQEYAMATLPFEQKYKDQIDEAADRRAKAIASAYEVYQTAVASATAICDAATTTAFKNFAVDTDELRRQRDLDLDAIRKQAVQQ